MISSLYYWFKISSNTFEAYLYFLLSPASINVLKRQIPTTSNLNNVLLYICSEAWHMINNNQICFNNDFPWFFSRRVPYIISIISVWISMVFHNFFHNFGQDFHNFPTKAILQGNGGRDPKVVQRNDPLGGAQMCGNALNSNGFDVFGIFLACFLHVFHSLLGGMRKSKCYLFFFKE